MSLSSIQALKRKNMQLFNFNIKEKKTSVITKIERGTPNEIINQVTGTVASKFQDKNAVFA